MTPPPGERLLRFVGDRVRFTLRAGAGRPGWRALLRTNLGRASARRREIISAHAGGAVAAGASWRDFGAIITVAKLADAITLVDQLAPEHLEIVAENAETLVSKIRNAGAIFIGAHTPEAIGDYIAGSNHVLPTARSARFSSGLGVLDFMKRTSLLKCGPEQLRALGPAAIALGEAEGLTAHARSVAIRLNQR